MEASSRLQLRVVESQEELRALKPHWQEILNALDEYPPFLTWEWMSVWWEIYKTNNTRLLVIVISDAAKIVTIAPFYVRCGSFPVYSKTIYFLGTGEPENQEVCSEYLDFVTLPAYAQEAGVKILSFLFSNNVAWNCMEFNRVLASSALQTFFVKKVSEKKYKVKNYNCGLRYYIELPNLWDEYLMSLKSSMRRSISVAIRNINKYPDYSVEFIKNQDEIDASMNELIELHTRSWKLKGKPGAFSSNEFVEFHKKIAIMFHKNNMLQMLKISLPDEVIAILYNIKILGTSYYYQSGLNMNKYSALKPGVLLHTHAIKNAISEKMKRYDFMMSGASSYKGHYGCEVMEMHHITIWNKGLRAGLMKKLALLPYFK